VTTFSQESQELSSHLPALQDPSAVSQVAASQRSPQPRPAQASSCELPASQPAARLLPPNSDPSRSWDWIRPLGATTPSQASFVSLPGASQSPPEESRPVEKPLSLPGASQPELSQPALSTEPLSWADDGVPVDSIALDSTALAAGAAGVGGAVGDGESAARAMGTAASISPLLRRRVRSRRVRSRARREVVIFIGEAPGTGRAGLGGEPSSDDGRDGRETRRRLELTPRLEPAARNDRTNCYWMIDRASPQVDPFRHLSYQRCNPSRPNDRQTPPTPGFPAAF
jgi:hypothetical protein